MLFQRQGNQNPQQRQAEAKNAMAEGFRVLPIQPGQVGEQQDHGKFRNLRGLKLNARQVNPAPGAVDLLADDEDAQQQRDAHAVQRPGEPIPDTRGNPAEKEHGRKADCGANRLLLQIFCGNFVAGVVFALGVACRIQHSQSHRQQQKHQQQKGVINAFPRPGKPRAAFLFGMEVTLRRHKILLSGLDINQQVQKCRTRPARTWPPSHRRIPARFFLPSSRTFQNGGGWAPS